MRLLPASDALADGTPEKAVLRLHELSREQFERYLRAWESVRAVYEEGEAFCALKYGR